MSEEPEESEENTEGTAPPAAATGAVSRRPVIKKRRKRKERQEELEQPDEFVEVGGTIVDWVLERGKPIGMAIGGILVILLVWGVVERMQSGDRLEASEALYLAQVDLPGGQNTALAPGLDAPDDADRLKKLDSAVAALTQVSTDFKEAIRILHR